MIEKINDFIMALGSPWPSEVWDTLAFCMRAAINLLVILLAFMVVLAILLGIIEKVIDIFHRCLKFILRRKKGHETVVQDSK